MAPRNRPTKAKSERLVKQAVSIMEDLIDLFGSEYDQPYAPRNERMVGTLAFDRARAFVRRAKSPSAGKELTGKKGI